MRVRWTIAAVIGAILVVAAGGILVAVGPGLRATEVVLEPIGLSGPDPFMSAMGRDRAGVAPPPDSDGSVSSATPGLYGGTGDDAACDGHKIGEFLTANPDKALAWAGALGIETGDIAGYISELTPAVLRSDTYAVNYGFSGGEATRRLSVLQAGTAVLVDKFGAPRVRCACGNPLAPAARPAGARFVGPAWRHFSTTQITNITVDVRNEITIVLNDAGRPQPVTVGGGSAEVTGPCQTDGRPVRFSAVISGQPGTEVTYHWTTEWADDSPPETTTLPLSGSRTVTLDSLARDGSTALEVDSPHRVTSEPVRVTTDCSNTSGHPVTVVGGATTPANGPCVDGAREVELSATITGLAGAAFTYRWSIEGAGTDTQPQEGTIPEAGSLTVQRTRVQAAGTTRATVEVLTPNEASASIESTVTCDGQAPDPTLTLSAGAIRQIDTYTATATGFEPGETLEFSRTGASSGLLTASTADGTGGGVTRIAAVGGPGTYTITVVGLTSHRTASAPLTVIDGNGSAEITVALTARVPDHDGPCPNGVQVQLWVAITGLPGDHVSYRVTRSYGDSYADAGTIPASGRLLIGDGGMIAPGSHWETVEVTGPNSASDRTEFTVACGQGKPDEY